MERYSYLNGEPVEKLYECWHCHGMVRASEVKMVQELDDNEVLVTMYTHPGKCWEYARNSTELGLAF